MINPDSPYTLSLEILRDTILGKSTWSRCPMCESTGVENSNEDGEDVKAGYPNSEGRFVEVCENCDGLGFVYRGLF